ncbi:MAG TPA: FAD-dependent oxidoreductase [Nitrososphaeraceae archaeon]|nr:FAD-dependent oxidoreductase [Nitrososphaeraceae archaeon]
MILKNQKNQINENVQNLIKIDFSLKREILYVVTGALIGAITMVLPSTIYEFFTGLPNYTSWIIFGHVIGVYSSYAAIAGFIIHLTTAALIGIVVGIFLYKTNILNISKPINGLIYGIFAGTIIFILWAIPINEFILIPENIKTIADINPLLTEQEISQQIQSNKLNIFLNSLFLNLLFGITVGLVSSYLSIKFGARYKCNICNVSFSRIDIIKKHLQLVHRRQPIRQKKIAILGGGFAGIEVLTKLQKEFQNDIRVDITLISKDNFFLFTPMLHEVSSGMIEPRHVASPLRSFCKRARFIESDVESIDLENKKIEFVNRVLESRITGNSNNVTKKNDYKKTGKLSTSNMPLNSLKTSNENIINYYHIDDNKNNINTDNDLYVKTLYYDYLVLALGSNTNFFGNKNLEISSFTMKSLYDAFSIRSHIIDTLEQTDMLLFEEKKDVIIEDKINDSTPIKLSHLNHQNDGYKFEKMRKSLTTYVVVGGGFAGVETIGEINDFIKESIRDYYQNIDIKDVRVILVNSGSRILPEMDEQLGDFALEELKKNNVEVVLNNRVINVESITDINTNKKNQLSLHGPKKISLKDNSYIIADTLIWTAGVVPEKSVMNIACEHDKSGRIVTDKYLQIKGFKDVYAIGDCALITDPKNGKPYPPTAQHAIREGQLTAENIISSLKEDLKYSNDTQKNNNEQKNNKTTEPRKKEYLYKTRGIMATIGKRNGVAMIFGHSIKGISAWGIWRLFYLTHLPTLENKIRVMIDWGIDLVFGRNLTRLKSPIETKDIKSKSIDDR